MNRRKLREHLFKMVFVYAFTLEKDMPEQLEMYLDGIEGLSEEDREELLRQLPEGFLPATRSPEAQEPHAENAEPQPHAKPAEESAVKAASEVQ